MSILDLLGKAWEEAQKRPMGIRFKGGAGIAYDSQFDKEQERKKQELLDLIDLYNKGYASYTPSFTQTQNAEEYLGGALPSIQAPEVLRGAGLPPLQGKAPAKLTFGQSAFPSELSPPPQASRTGRPLLSNTRNLPPLEAPQMSPLPEGTIKLPMEIGGSRFWTMPLETKEKKKNQMSDYAYEAYAKVLNDPDYRKNILKDVGLTAYEKATILEDTKPSKGSSSLNFGTMSPTGASVYVDAANEIADGEMTKADVISIVKDTNIPAREKAYIVDKLRTKSLTEIIAELVATQQKK